MAEVILAASQCRTTITEVYQSGSATTAPGINGWGCEANTGGVAGSAPSKYVLSVTTTANGQITVTTTTGAFGDTSLDGKTLTLTPYSDTTQNNPMVVPGSMGTQVAAWKCAAPAAGGVPAQFLPGSCK